MLTPEYLNHCTDHLLGLYDELDRAIIADISRRIVKTGGITATAEHQIDKVQQSGMLLSDVTKEVATVTRFSEEEIERLFNEAGIVGMQNDVKPLILAGQQVIPGMERNSPLPVLNGEVVGLNLSPAMKQVLEAAIAKTKGDLRNLTMTTGVTASSSYLEAVNAAYMKVQSGAFTYQQAIREAVKEAAVGGNHVSYPSGRLDQLDTAVRRSVLTGLNQTCGKLTELYGKDLGCEYYETSAHGGARPSHAVWQGRVFKIEGATADYPNFEESTGYGTGAGLCGWNCRHSFYPFWPGISSPAYTKEMLDSYDRPKYSFNGDKLTEYEVSQLMRECERKIRESKREVIGFQAAMDAASGPTKEALKTDYETAVLSLKSREAAYKELCRQTRQAPDGARTSVVAVKGKDGSILSFDRSTAQRARQAKIRLEKERERDIIKSSGLEKALQPGQRLPNSLRAQTDANKIQGYALNSNHPVGKEKARVFNSVLGYHYENWNKLSDQIFNGVQTGTVSKVTETQYGTKYEVPLRITGEKKKSMVVNTVWQVDKGKESPRLITLTFDKRTIRSEN